LEVERQGSESRVVERLSLPGAACNHASSKESGVSPELKQSNKGVLIESHEIE